MYLKAKSTLRCWQDEVEPRPSNCPLKRSPLTVGTVSGGGGGEGYESSPNTGVNLATGSVQAYFSDIGQTKTKQPTRPPNQMESDAASRTSGSMLLTP